MLLPGRQHQKIRRSFLPVLCKPNFAKVLNRNHKFDKRPLFRSHSLKYKESSAGKRMCNKIIFNNTSSEVNPLL